MPQAAVQNFGGLTALRILSGAFEAIADPALMLFTSMFYTRAEQPSRISCWYAFNGLGVAGGGLIGTYFFRSFVCHTYRRVWNR
jgi:MFS family permease